VMEDEGVGCGLIQWIDSPGVDGNMAGEMW
jgi:hypothetical protein